MPNAHLNILVADDEAVVRSFVLFVLKHAGHSVDVVHDGQDAFVKIQAEPDRYDLLITDHAMANLSGLDLVKKVRGTPFKGRILVISGHLTVKVEDAFRALMVDKIIYKPFRPQELIEAVEALSAIILNGGPH